MVTENQLVFNAILEAHCSCNNITYIHSVEKCHFCGEKTVVRRKRSTIFGRRVSIRTGQDGVRGARTWVTK